MNSSMAERRFVKPLVESSNLSSSARFVDEYNSEMSRMISTSIHNKQPGALAEWIYMRRSEIPEILVQFQGAPQY
jgi:hypothetical protein